MNRFDLFSFYPADCKVWWVGQESIKQTCEIYEKQSCFVLGAISAEPCSWILGLFNNMGAALRLVWFVCMCV